MLNSQNHHQPENNHNNHQNQLQYHQRHQQDIINNFDKDFIISTDRVSSTLQKNFSLSSISSSTAAAAAAAVTTATTIKTSIPDDTFYSTSNAINNNYQNYKQMIESNHANCNNSAADAFFSFNDLTTALQQDHLTSSSSSSSALIESTNSSSSTSTTTSAIFGTDNNNVSVVIKNCRSPSTSSVISSNRISSSPTSPPISLHSSNGTLNLGNNIINSSTSNRINEHYNNNKHQNHYYHNHNNLNHRHHNIITSQHNNNNNNNNNMNNQQQQQTYHNTNNSNNLGSNPFSYTSGNDTRGISSAGHSNIQHQIQLHQQQHHNHQHQQQQHHHQQQEHHQHQSQQQQFIHQQNQLSSSQQSHSLQRSMSSTSSSMASPTSATSQHHIHHHMQMQNNSTSSLSTNKSCWCIGGDATYHFKTLVPAVASGAIIGKGGETIAALQRDTGARVKMSKSHDFYPGTQERVCLITGSIEAIMTVLDFIMDKIREKPDLTTKLTDIESKQAQERDKQVKILVPNSTAGMIIGKAGAYIKQIKEESGSYVQISQKPKDITLQERCITIIGEKDNNKIACKMILAKIVEDPQSGTCLNVSYADVSGPVANYNPTGSPYATNQNAISSSTASLNSALGTTVTGAGLLLNGTGINLSVNLGAPNPSPNPIATQVLDHIKVAMRGSGYSDTVTTEVCAALAVLAKYGVLGVGVGLPHTNGAHSAPVSYLGVSALDQSAAGGTVPTAGSVFSALGQVNLEQYITGQSTATPRQTTIDAAAQFDPFRHTTSQAATPISINNNSFGLAAAATTGGATAQALGAQALGAISKSPTPGDLGAKDAKNVEISEHIVGAILGPSGRNLVEIQHASGANIQISKKGIFAPGTRNRIVTISGQPNAITMAHILIEQKINEEEAKRARQNTVATAVIQ